MADYVWAARAGSLLTAVFTGVAFYAGFAWRAPVPAVVAGSAIVTVLVQRALQDQPWLRALRNALAAFTLAEVACLIGLYFSKAPQWLLVHDALHVVSLAFLVQAGAEIVRSGNKRGPAPLPACSASCDPRPAWCAAARIAGAASLAGAVLAGAVLAVWWLDGSLRWLGRPEGVSDASRLFTLAAMPAFSGAICTLVFAWTGLTGRVPRWIGLPTTALTAGALAYSGFQLFTHLLLPVFAVPVEEVLEFLPLVVLFHVFAVPDAAWCAVAPAALVSRRSLGHAWR
jgi:hypothetical protein